jgi:two-component system, sensor histidine kinase YesM
MLNFLKIINIKVRKMGISARITIFYSLLLVSTLLFSGIFYQRIYSEIMLKKVSTVSMQTLQSVSSNVGSLLKTVNNYSKMILGNPAVQTALKSNQGYEDVEIQRHIFEYMESVMSSTSEIISLYIIDNKGNRFYTDKLPNFYQYFNMSKDSEWWTRALRLKGRSYVVLNGGDAFSREANELFISNIRIVNDLESQKPIGALIINISENMFVKAYSEIAKNYETEIIIVDENNNIVISTNPLFEDKVQDFIKKAENRTRFSELVKEDKLLYSYMKMEEYNWKVISMIPFGEVKRESQIFMLVTFIIILIIALLIMVGSIIIAGMITKPINILVKSMKNINSGVLEEVQFETSIHEFIRLRDGYNLMTEEIQSLVKRVIKEEKIKRKAEMNILQAQIKPHFLYNTFDSISSLALMGRNEDVYNMMSALGSFYRISLSKGKEIISIEEELETIRNYLEILKVRYEDLFTVCYSLDPQVSNKPTVKLILQPFIENALYHGIKPKDEPGIIEVKTWQENKRICLMIKDDGVGMSTNQLSSLLNDSPERNNSNNFGIWGTVQRLKLYYGEDDIVSIQSEKGKGTTVIISIPEFMADET